MKTIKHYLSNEKGFFVFDKESNYLLSWNLPNYEPYYTEAIEEMNKVLSFELGKKINVGRIKSTSYKPIKVYKKNYSGAKNGW